MNKPARKPGDSRSPDSLPADDPSIPVLTERLTLPPLDLDLDFRLPPRPAGDAPAPAPAAPAEPPVAHDDDATRYMPRVNAPTVPAEPTFEQRYLPADDEKTRLAVEGRRAFDPAYLDDATGTRIAPRPLPAPGRDEVQEDVAPVAPRTDNADDIGAAEATRFDTRRDAWGGMPTAGFPLGPDSVIGPNSVLSPNSVIAPDTRGGPITLSAPDTRGGPITLSAPDTRGGLVTQGAPDTRAGPATVMPPAEPVEDAPRVPTSLLVSNLTQPASTAPTHRRPQQDDFDVPVTQPGLGNVDALDAELRERILLDLARRLPSDVDAIVRRHLETAIDEAVRRFAAEVRIALAGSLREIVDRAVKGELDRLKSPRR